MNPYTLQPVLQAIPVEDTSPPPPATLQATSPTKSFFPKRPSVGGAAMTRVPSFQGRTGVDAVDSWDNNLYIGTSEGVVLHYTIEDSISSESLSARSRLETKVDLGVGKKMVERILVLPQVSKAVVLCDSILSFYTLPFLEPIPTDVIPQIKGVACFCHDVAEEIHIGADGTLRLCVVKRRQVQLLKVGEHIITEREINLQDTALVAACHRTTMFLADSKEYKLLDLKQGLPYPLIPTPQPVQGAPGSSSQTATGASGFIPRPIITVVGEGEFLLVSGSGGSNSTIGMFVSATGDPIRGTLEWTSYPRSVGVEFPYVAAVLRNNTIEIHNINDQSLIQTLQFHGGFEPRGISPIKGVKVWVAPFAERLRRVAINHNGVEIQSEESMRQTRDVKRIATVSTRLLVYGKDSVQALLANPLALQVDTLLDGNRVEEALGVANHMRLNVNRDMDKLKYELDYINQKTGFVLLGETLFDDAFSRLFDSNIDPRAIINLFPELTRKDIDESEEEIILFQGVYLTIQKLGTIEDIVTQNLTKNYSPHAELSATEQLHDVLLANSKEALTKYLEQERERRRPNIGKGTEIGCAIDTALVKLLAGQEDSAGLYKFLGDGKENDCVVGEVEEMLIELKKYYALSLLWKSKNQYDKVLEFWTKIQSGDLPDPDFKQPIPQITDLLLDSVEDPDIVYRYAWWVMERNPALGILVFTSSTKPAVRGFDTQEVLHRMEEMGIPQYVRRYLEYMIETRGSEEEFVHTRLALFYLDDVLQKAEMEGGKSAMEGLVAQFMAATRTSQRPPPFLLWLSRNLSSNASSPHPRLKFIYHLQTSRFYAASKILPRLHQAEYLKLEEAIVSGKAGEHEPALQILVRDLKDYAGAEWYCLAQGDGVGVFPGGMFSTGSSKITSVIGKMKSMNIAPTPPKGKNKGRPTMEEDRKIGLYGGKSGDMIDEDRRGLFLLLLRIYLGIEERDVMLAKIVHLLNTYGIYLDPLLTLELIPENWSVNMLSDFIIRSLRRIVHEHREGQILLGMSRGENLMITSALIQIQEAIGPIIIKAGETCTVCMNLIGNAVFARSPDGKFLHLACSQKEEHAIEI